MEYFRNADDLRTDPTYQLRYLTLKIPFKREYNLNVPKTKQLKKERKEFKGTYTQSTS